MPTRQTHPASAAAGPGEVPPRRGSFIAKQDATQVELDLEASLMALDSESFRNSECNLSLRAAFVDAALWLTVGVLLWVLLATTR